MTQFVGFGQLRIDFAELFLNRPQLLAQIELALIFLHLALNVRLNLVSELDDLELLGQQHRELAHPLLGVAFFEHGLAIGRIETHRRRHEVREQVRIGDVLDFHLHLARSLRQISQQFLEKRCEVALHRDEFVGGTRDVGQFRVLCNHIRIGGGEFLDLEDALTSHDAAQRAVRHFEHLLHGPDRSDAMHVVGSRIFDVAVCEQREPDRFAFAQSFFDQLNAGTFYHGQRNDRVGKEHRVLQRQKSDFGHYASTRFTVIRISVRDAGIYSSAEIGSAIVSKPSS